MSDTLNIKQRSLFSEILILIKHRLSLSVVFSSVASYLIAFEVFSLYTLMLLIFGGFFVVGASNGFNQIIERKRDALMIRTQNRPLPTGGLSVSQAILVCVILSFLGLFIFKNIYLVFSTYWQNYFRELTQRYDEQKRFQAGVLHRDRTH